jgi:hypothetical protein
MYSIIITCFEIAADSWLLWSFLAYFFSYGSAANALNYTYTALTIIFSDKSSDVSTTTQSTVTTSPPNKSYDSVAIQTISFSSVGREVRS